MEEDDLRESLLRQFCDYERQFTWLLVICTTFAVIQAPYLLVAERGTELFALSALNLAGLVFFGGVSGVILWRCRKLAERQPF